MLYCSKAENGTYTVKRSDTRIENVSSEIIDALGWKQKMYPWFYENECRLVVTIKKEDLPAEAVTTVKIPMNGMITNITKLDRVYCAPNNSEDKYSASTLQGRINWDLCNKCSPSKPTDSKETHSIDHSEDNDPNEAEESPSFSTKELDQILNP